ncbi:MAG: tRNA threonylcarbamoyladenosine biosynthesis protein TsaB [Actinomycetota bacterium]
MIVLGIESATARAGVALGTADGVIASAEVTRGPRHAEILTPAVRFVCEQAGVALSAVDVVAVDIGPGLFTGLRVGIATANGLAQALGVPMIGVASLDVLAHHARYGANEIVAVIDARRSEVYTASYGVSDAGLKRIVEPRVIAPAELLAELDGRSDVTLVGDTLREYGAVFALPSVEALVQIAAPIAQAGGAVAPSAIVPLYLRRSDAELNAERLAAPPGKGA